MSLCECGCGRAAAIAKRTEKKHGRFKGKPTRFAYGHTGRKSMVGYKQQGHEKGRYLHRLMAERALGRPLPAGVDVHHVDEDTTSTTPRLVICQDRAYHKLLHVRARVLRAGGNPNTERICGGCKQIWPLSEFVVSRANKSTGRGSRCRACRSAFNKTYVRPSASAAATA